jgi:hypothetical protein
MLVVLTTSSRRHTSGLTPQSNTAVPLPAASSSAGDFLTYNIARIGKSPPIENMPGWLQPFTFANPLRYMMVIVKGVFLKSFPAADVFANVWPIAVIAAFTLSLCDLVFPPSPGVGGGRKEEHEQRGALGC